MRDWKVCKFCKVDNQVSINDMNMRDVIDSAISAMLVGGIA